MFIDSHCHLDRLNLDHHHGHLDSALAAARAAGVTSMLCVGIDLNNAPIVVELADRYPEVYAAVGVHPLDCGASLPDITRLQALINHKKVIAIGETGLDYYHTTEHQAVQQQSFIAHLQMAADCQLPAIVHTRDAREDTLALIKAHGDLDTAGVLHCFTESWAMAKAAMDLNYYISISGIVTFHNATALRDVVRQLPMDRLLIETDAPYLAPVPHRGKPNEPQYVAEVAHCVAELKKVSVAQLAEQTTANFYRLFAKASQPIDTKI